ncbi:MAG: YadA C-terminal domain-containing protein, partial [Psychrilyobacter sp.]|nr:YadA C-terminal domain-containing protein [Psychrilyobacter sp.]
AINDNDERITKNKESIGSLKSESRKGISGVAAISGIKYQAMKKGEGQIGVGYGNFRGESSIAIGLGAQVSENIMMNGAVSGTAGTDSEVVISAGATYKFNFFN